MALKNFDSEAFLQNWSEEKFNPLQSGKPLAQCLREAFGIPRSDAYVYRAQAETTLDMTQRAIGAKRDHGLHGWYHDDEGKPIDPQYPTPEDITAYTALFSPSLSLPKALTSLKANAKPTTLRSPISLHLTSRYHNTCPGLLPSKKDRAHTNPYLSLWTYSCQELEWAGPLPATTCTKISHHVLPVFYHHFGCVVPSYAALHVIAKLAQPLKPSKQNVLPILDVGSGNGYWTFMLRHFPVADIAGAKPLQVVPVDNQLSEYRVSWVKDTVKMDGVAYLKQHEGGKGSVLLLVYPQATGNFTAAMLKAFEGDKIVVAGTQNGNGFTGFQDMVVDEWIAEHLPAFELALRMPLPSFAGKDEAIFVFLREN
ncbi:hypothetical protein ACN47E_003527 [Coniothyrium glycines]